MENKTEGNWMHLVWKEQNSLRFDIFYMSILFLLMKKVACPISLVFYFSSGCSSERLRLQVLVFGLTATIRLCSEKHQPFSLEV